MNKLKINMWIIAVSASILTSFAPPETGVKYSAYFLANNIRIYEKTTLAINYYHAQAFIVRKTGESLNPFYGNESGSVAFNNSALYYNGHARGYFDTIIRNDATIKWDHSSSDQLASFQHISTSAYPVLDNVSGIPDELRLNEDLIVSLENASGYDEVEFTIEDAEFHASRPWYRRIPATATLVIPKSNLSGLVGPYVRMRVTLIKNETSIVEGKVLKFENRLVIVKKAEVKR